MGNLVPTLMLSAFAIYFSHLIIGIGKRIITWQSFIYKSYIIKIIITMGNLLYVIAVILVIAWAIGYLGYQAGGLIHILLVIAIIAVLLKVIRRGDV